MWIKTALYEEAVRKQAESLGIASALQARVISQQATMDWLMVRLTQLEHERAQLISNYMGITIAVPSIEPKRAPVNLSSITEPAISFADVGDEEAERMGIEWDEQGEVIYGR